MIRSCFRFYPAFDAYPWFNPKLSLQYTIYNKLDGSTASVSDNDTLYPQAWLLL